MIRSFLVRGLYFVEECLDIGGQLGHMTGWKDWKYRQYYQPKNYYWKYRQCNATSTTENTNNTTTTAENTNIVIHCCHFIIPQHSIVDGQLLKIPATLSAPTSNWRIHYPQTLNRSYELAHESQFKALGRTNLGVVLALSRLVMGESEGSLWRDFNNNICTKYQLTTWKKCQQNFNIFR